MRKPVAVGIIACLLVLSVFSVSALAVDENNAAKPKNIILLIGDGMGFGQMYITKLVYGHLNMENMPYTGYEYTYSLSGEVTDSAAAGTAIATGFKTLNGMISMLPNGKNLTTLLELAQKLGKSTGLVTTTRITHATPAVFASHVPDRDEEKEIARQLIEHRVNVLFGGGKKEFTQETLELAKKYGYQIVYDKEGLEKARGNYVLGLFAESHIPYVLDRDKDQVGLLEMTKKAIEILSRNPNGFFLMIEGGRIDHASHGNDIASVVAETKEFDDVVGYVLEFAKKSGDTLVIVVADHETGGLAIGLSYGDAINERAIKRIKASTLKMAQEIKSGKSIEEVLRKYAGFTPTKDEIEEIKNAMNSSSPYALPNAIAEVINKRVGVGFISHKHTGIPIPIMAYGPGAENFVGMFHHVEMSKEVARLMMFGDKEIPLSIKPSSVKGDLDGNGRIDKGDAYLALMLVGTPANTEIIEKADMDNNGIIDYTDVYEIYAEATS